MTASDARNFESIFLFLFLDLRLDKAVIGREAPSDENVDAFVFTNEICQQKYVDRISKCHFTIERLKSNVSSDPMDPAVLTCFGRNGLYINDNKLKVDERKILNNNDIIKLSRSYEIFKFCYRQSAPETDSLPQTFRKSYYVGNQIGSGGCGLVRLTYNLKTMEKFAMKVIKKETNNLVRTRLQDNVKILNEVDIMRKLSHPHVLSLMDFYETPAQVLIIMEFMEGRDLLYRITQHDPKRKSLTELDAKFFFMQACHGLKYLHDSKVTHRDIKPDNILLADNSPNALLKISDFGLSKLISVETMKTVCGTQLYVAPEVLFGGAYTNKVDVWSMGCLLFAMLSGSVPFCDAYGPPDVQTQIKQAKFCFKSRIWNEVSRLGRDLIRQMLKKEPKQRPSIVEVLQHPWLKCNKTIARVQGLFALEETLMHVDTELERSMTKISLQESQQSAIEPPLKRRRVE